MPYPDILRVLIMSSTYSENKYGDKTLPCLTITIIIIIIRNLYSAIMLGGYRCAGGTGR